jgi:DNA repair protein RadC
MKIHDLPLQNRPRERFQKYGPRVLSDAELFAILLRTGTQNENVIDMSHRLIAEYGLDKLFDCSLIELQKIKGIGQAKSMQILALSEISKRIAMSKKPITKITSAEDVFDYFHERLKDKKQEEFWVLMLNAKNHIIAERFTNKGIADSAITHPREIFRDAIKNSASKIILIHNHPSGDPTPSQEDLDITKNIMKLGDELGIKVLDHVILGRDRFWSFKEEN